MQLDLNWDRLRSIALGMAKEVSRDHWHYDDMVQEALIRAFRYSKTAGSITYIRRTMRTAMMDFLLKEQYRQAVPLEEHHASSDGIQVQDPEAIMRFVKSRVNITWDQRDAITKWVNGQPLTSKESSCLHRFRANANAVPGLYKEVRACL